MTKAHVARPQRLQREPHGTQALKRGPSKVNDALAVQCEQPCGWKGGWLVTSALAVLKPQSECPPTDTHECKNPRIQPVGLPPFQDSASKCARAEMHPKMYRSPTQKAQQPHPGRPERSQAPFLQRPGSDCRGAWSPSGLAAQLRVIPGCSPQVRPTPPRAGAGAQEGQEYSVEAEPSGTFRTAGKRTSPGPASSGLQVGPNQGGGTVQPVDPPDGRTAATWCHAAFGGVSRSLILHTVGRPHGRDRGH